MPAGRTKDKYPEKEETKLEAQQEQEEIDESLVKKEVPVEEKVEKKAANIEVWQPKTELGRKVKAGEISNLGEIFDKGLMIKESEIIDVLMPNMETDLLLIGQSKGKFGGGQRRAFKQTQKKTQEGNKPKFATFAVIGNRDGYVGLGYGKAKETVPAREKATRKAKVNLIKIRRGCGSWQCGCKQPHSIPFAVEGGCGSVRIKLMPAPRGTGLSVASECQKILGLSGIKDVWSKTQGQTGSRINIINALLDALRKLSQIKVQLKQTENLGLSEGAANE